MNDERAGRWEESVRQVIGGLASQVEVDQRRPPDQARAAKFRQGWREAAGSAPNTRNARIRLSWLKLGRLLGSELGDQAPKKIDEAFRIAAELYEEGHFLGTGLRWVPRTQEDHLLQRYWNEHGGRIYTEVFVGAEGGSVPWSDGSAVRRIDAVRFPEGEPPGVFVYSGHKSEFSQYCSEALEAEIIEIKRGLNRPVIGQAMAGKVLFEQQHGPSGTPVVVCGSGDAALEWACEQIGIRVWLP